MSHKQNVQREIEIFKAEFHYLDNGYDNSFADLKAFLRLSLQNLEALHRKEMEEVRDAVEGMKDEAMCNGHCCSASDTLSALSTLLTDKMKG